MNKEIKKEYRAGFDCGINGANEENCNFRLFATPEQIEEWRRGKKDADKIGRYPKRITEDYGYGGRVS